MNRERENPFDPSRNDDPQVIASVHEAPWVPVAAQVVPQIHIWHLHFVAVAHLVYRLFPPAKPGCRHPRFKIAMAQAVPISLVPGSFFGARITSLCLPGARLEQVFGLLMVEMVDYKVFTLLG